MKFKLSVLAFAMVQFSFAQENVTYQKPSAEILQLADYERPPSIMTNSGKDWLVMMYRPTYATLQDLSQEEMKLGGLRINPITNISSSMTYSDNIKIRKMTDKQEMVVKNLPQNPQIAYTSFSPDEKKLAFTNTTSQGVELYVIDLATNTAKKITSDNLNANVGMPYTWAKDSQSLMIKVLPQNRDKLLSSANDLPSGPVVSTSDGKVSQNRTYQDLLKNPMDEHNFKTLVTSELHKVDLNGKMTKFKDANLYMGNSYSPDGKFVMLTYLREPFSYIVPLNRFPMTSEVYTAEGKMVKTVNEIPLNEIMPKGFSSTRAGKRDMSWRDDEPATIVYVQALDGGDQSKQVEFRDEIFTWKAPFTTAPVSFFKTKQRYNGVEWSNAPYAVVSESWYDTRNSKSFLVNLKDGSFKTLEDRNSQDIYADPGYFNSVKNEYGRNVIDVKDGNAYLIGAGFTKDGQFPFVDEMNVNSLTKKRLYTSKLKNSSEKIIDILDIKKGDLLVVEQSPTQYPNYYTRNFKTNKVSEITNLKNPFESLNKVYKEVITYKRNDGVSLSGTLYLPANYDRVGKKEKLPLLVWAYPREYKDKSTAGQSSQNPNDFTFPSYGSFIYWVAKGYAVLDDASFPIIGEGTTEPNDTFITQLVADGRAAIDAVDKLGYIDRTKVAVGGHSYGAFMTANLLTHSKDYACGIARSGAYNRTLTPFGFQSEQRNYWDNPTLYNAMSPFMNADKMKTPLLLIHGAADNNPGTFTLQTERYFEALKNLGAPVRMVLLPKEAHGYRAKENIMHTLWEEDQFLEKCLKNK